jgi:hypothetical protein
MARSGVMLPNGLHARPLTSLSTDSDTGALSLYERVGMRIHRSFAHLSLDLR